MLNFVHFNDDNQNALGYSECPYEIAAAASTFTHTPLLLQSRMSMAMLRPVQIYVAQRS